MLIIYRKGGVELKLFETVVLSGNKYAALIIGTSCEAPSKYLKEIASELQAKQVKGTIILDMLLHSGNSDERFISVDFDGEKFDDCTFKFIKVEKNNDTRKLSATYFQDYPEIVEYSILNSIQKKLILKGCAI